MRHVAIITLVLLASVPATAFAHGGTQLATGSADGLSAALYGTTLPAGQSPDGRERVDYTVQVTVGKRPVSDARVVLSIERGGRVERRVARRAAGAYEVLVKPEEGDRWRRWPVSMSVQRASTRVKASYRPPDSSAPSWLPFLGVLLVPVAIFAGARLVRRHREAGQEG